MTKEEDDNIIYFDKEFLHRNVHYEPGWYWPDEEGDLYGPFITYVQAQRGLQIYIQQLMDGVAPTQIDKTKLIGQQQPNAHEED